MTDATITAKTEGQRLLLAVPDAPRDICASTGAAKSLVSQWRAGTKRPGRAWREVLLRTYAIPIAAWDAGPQDQAPPPSPASAGAELAAAPSSGPPPEASTLGAVRAHVARLEQELARQTDLPARERHQLEQRYMAALRLQASIERDAELQEHRIVTEHPSYRRARSLILAVLERKHPEAFRDLVAAFEAEGL